MTLIITGLITSMYTELTAQAKPMARPAFFTNHWSMTADMATPVVNAMPAPMTSAETQNCHASV